MTLTQAAILTRRSIISLIILTILSISVFFGYKIWYQYYYLPNLPPVEEKAENKFGTLPKVDFPPASVSSSNFSYSLDTVTGGLPQTPKILKVYFLPQAGISLMAPEKAQRLAQTLGFPKSSTPSSEISYHFANDSGGELKVDITTGNFEFQRLTEQNSESSPDFTKLNNNTVEIVNFFKDYLLSKNLLPEELKNGRSKVNMLASDTLAEVSLWPVEVDSIPVVTANFNQGLVKATLTSESQEEKKIIKLNYTFWPIDQTTSSTYKLKNTEQAFADLRAGLGYISTEPEGTKVSISSVYLAYFESSKYSPYLQPVFVFEGPSFIALVPAVQSEN